MGCNAGYSSLITIPLQCAKISIIIQHLSSRRRNDKVVRSFAFYCCLLQHFQKFRGCCDTMPLLAFFGLRPFPKEAGLFIVYAPGQKIEFRNGLSAAPL